MCVCVCERERGREREVEAVFLLLQGQSAKTAESLSSASQSERAKNDTAITSPDKSSLQKDKEDISERSESAQGSRAPRMGRRGGSVVPEANVGDGVMLSVPNTFRGRSDPTHLHGMIYEKHDHGLYTIALKCGVLQEKFKRKQFDVCSSITFTTLNVNTDRRVSLKKALQLQEKPGTRPGL